MGCAFVLLSFSVLRWHGKGWVVRRIIKDQPKINQKMFLARLNQGSILKKIVDSIKELV